jgi:hypothetical protein
MAISEQQLETWSHQGSVKQSAATYETIKAVLHDPRAPYASKSFDSFLQGSYGNSTNIYADSDVDIAIMLTSTYYSDLSPLSDAEKQRYNDNRIPASYSYDDFKAEVLLWLKQHFGPNVRVGNKAIFIPGNGNRRDADVLVCVKHRAFHTYESYANSTAWDGIAFWTTDDTKIVNYPKQHLANCTKKHQDCANMLKRNVRVFKNMRNAMVANNFIKKGVAPSYFLEGLLWNVPDQHFTNGYQQTFENCFAWLRTANLNDLMCGNNIHYLIRDGHHVCWNSADYASYRTAAIQYWNSRNH